MAFVFWALYLSSAAMPGTLFLKLMQGMFSLFNQILFFHILLLMGKKFINASLLLVVGWLRENRIQSI
jgi:hypothetical protein